MRPSFSICIVTPALASANNGNWHTASRWARMLANDYRVRVVDRWDGAPDAVLVALHARRSAESVLRWRAQRPGAPLVLVLTGTDLYRDIRADADADAQAALHAATRIVVLQRHGLDELPAALRARAAVIVQSAPRLAPLAGKAATRLTAVMVGHLRDEKDPLAFMHAARRLAARGDLHFRHVGAALDPALAEAARATERAQPRYRWLGDVPRAAARQHMRRAHVLVHASRIEGGAQAVIEAVQAGTPVLCSRIPGNLGLLGDDWPASFAVGDDAALAALLERTRDEAGFLRELEARAAAIAPRFEPAAERAALLALLRGLCLEQAAPTLA